MNEQEMDKISPKPLVMPEWHNEDNNLFYETIKVDGLKEFAVKAGLDTCCDLDLLQPYWSKAESILDVGAGYGRAIDYLLKHDFQGQITAVERCNVLFDYLESNFKHCENVTLLHEDMRHLKNTRQKFDLVFMLWSTIADFPAKDQADIFLKLKLFLNVDGILVIDTMPENTIPLQACKSIEQVHFTKVNDVTVCTYEPSEREINDYSQKAKFTKMGKLVYSTKTRRNRWMYLLD